VAKHDSLVGGFFHEYSLFGESVIKMLKRRDTLQLHFKLASSELERKRTDLVRPVARVSGEKKRDRDRDRECWLGSGTDIGLVSKLPLMCGLLW
jgi:hypothetical protein